MKSVIYIILIFTVYSCSSTRSNTHIEKQLALEDILLTSIQESSYLKELDTIYIYDHFSFDTVRANRYYHSINADIQLAFVDTFHTKIDSVSYPILWDKLRSYKNLKDTRSRIVENYFDKVKNKTIVFVTELELRNYRYIGETIYFPSLILSFGNRKLFSLRYGLWSGQKIIYLSFEKKDGKFILKEEQDQIAESNVYVIEDWINQINFNQSLDSYWKNDYLDMVKLFDDNWDKECVKLTGDKCQRLKLMDMVKK